jgi:beta-lactamase class A
MMRLYRELALALVFAFAIPLGAGATSMPGPLQDLQDRLDRAAFHAPGTIGIEIEDLATGMRSGINASASLPAASTIKIPVMVEVFRQMASGTIDLNTTMHLQASDRDWGSGDLAGARIGDRKNVEQLLWLMINDSDNTATNMLIRLVHRQNVNRTMSGLGLRTTHLSDYIRTDTDQIRYALRSSPSDLVMLLDSMARDRLIDTWSSREMLAILDGQTHNGLLPGPLPKGLKIAHKTGSLHDTLNDVGIVYLSDEPYVIAVMTTQLRSLSNGRHFIHNISKMTYDEIGRMAAWRESTGLPAFKMSGHHKAASTQALAPDLKMWGVSDAPELNLPGS